ncbi:mediator complex subunit MED4, putative [Babesia ovis]|uniref:Mediator complex subunit MED4, putative n=1 Tax=Babesia ovis TaxID=5869 RepID=A0A9W5TAP0_BABOV|nr:mediator complex subunit MED4, putative [Babesia ovis]
MTDDLARFAKQIADIVKDDWEHIPDPNSNEWKTAFDNAVDAYLAGETTECNYVQNKEESRSNRQSAELLAFSGEDREKLAQRAYAMLEGLWLAGRRKVEAIDQYERSTPLHLSEVVSYAQRLSSTTYSPPENMNVHDPTRHFETFPNYHFLGMPSVSQMHASRLFDLNRLEELSSAPRVIFEPISEDMHRMRLECSTPNAVIHYQTSRVNTSQTDPHTGQPTVYTTAPEEYDPSKNLNFKTVCNPFVVMTWSTCEGLRQSEVVRVEYRPPSVGNEADGTPAKKSFGLLLERERKS